MHLCPVSHSRLVLSVMYWVQIRGVAEAECTALAEVASK